MTIGQTVEDTMDALEDQGHTDWRNIPPQTYVPVEGRARKSREGPEWGTGPYRGQKVINKHLNKTMYALRPSRRQPSSYKWGGAKEHVYSDALDRLVRIIMARINADQQIIIHIGDANGNGTGSGKSTLALALACDLARAMKRQFKLQEDLILDAPAFLGRAQSGKDDGILVMDEAHEILGTNKASERGAKTMRTCFATLRSKHNISILVSPRLTGLTTIIESEICDIRILCSNPQSSWIPSIGRGLFQVYLAERRQTFSRGSKTTFPFWRLIMTGLFYPAMLPKGIWEEYSVFKDQFQAMMLRREMAKVEANDPDAMEFANRTYGRDPDIAPIDGDAVGQIERQKDEVGTRAVKVKKPRGRPKKIPAEQNPEPYLPLSARPYGPMVVIPQSMVRLRQPAELLAACEVVGTDENGETLIRAPASMRIKEKRKPSRQPKMSSIRMIQRVNPDLYGDPNGPGPNTDIGDGPQ